MSAHRCSAHHGGADRATRGSRGDVRPRAWTLLLAVTMALVGTLVTPGSASATDTVRERQWGLRAINAPDAWRTTKGKGVTVAVLDTGVDADHPDLRGQVLKGKDFVGIGAKPGDPDWAKHGTAMAGIIAGRGHGPGDQEGVLGVAPQARILPVRVLLEDSDPQRDQARGAWGEALADGIRWAVDQGADVINLSLGDDSASAHPTAEEDAAVRYALSKGVVVVASAGNGGEQGNRASYPAAYPGVIAVTAVDRQGRHAAFSTSRWYAAVSAPGDDVIVTNPDRRYYEGWGTSTAAAFVSGSVALLRAAYPDLSPAQVRQVLMDTAQQTPAGGRSDALGTGIVDPAAAMELAARLDPAPPLPSPAPHDREYFGSGPDPQESGSLTGWLAPVAALLGVALVGGAVVLFRGVSRRPMQS